MSESESKQPREFIQYMKQRDEALETIKTKDRELRVTQSKLYDAKKQIEELRKKVKEAESKTNKSTSKKLAPTTTTTTTSTSKRTSVPRTNKSPISASSNGNDSGPARDTTTVSSTRSDGDGLYHPHIADMEPVPNSREYYWKIAEMFPTLPMYQIIEVEKKFIEVDTECNGTIDIHALDKALSNSVGMFTQKQLEEIFKEIDTDNSGTIDFQKVLITLNRLFTRRKTTLPQSIQQNYTKICKLQ